MFCFFIQLDNAIPLFQDKRDDLKDMKGDPKAKGNTDAIMEDIKGLREDIQPGYAMQFRQVSEDIRAIKERLGMS